MCVILMQSKLLFNPNWMKTFFCTYPEDVVACPENSATEQEFVRVEASFPVMTCASHPMLEDVRFSTVFSGCVRLPFG